MCKLNDFLALCMEAVIALTGQLMVHFLDPRLKGVLSGMWAVCHDVTSVDTRW